MAKSKTPKERVLKARPGSVVLKTYMGGKGWSRRHYYWYEIYTGICGKTARQCWANAAARMEKKG